MKRRHLTWSAHSGLVRASCQLLATTGALFLASTCARTGLDGGELDPTPTGSVPGPDASVEPAPTATATAPPTPTAAPREPCVPTTEICNGQDDDCNGVVDEVLAEACAQGGFRYCVSGRLSACPSRCESCVPGSERICFISYCTFWGVQTCAADGRGFGGCREEHAPSACSRHARDRSDRKELEQCCLDQGYCCVDVEDLDNDGDRREMLGRCDEVTCR